MVWRLNFLSHASLSLVVVHDGREGPFHSANLSISQLDVSNLQLSVSNLNISNLKISYLDILRKGYRKV